MSSTEAEALFAAHADAQHAKLRAERAAHEALRKAIEDGLVHEDGDILAPEGAVFASDVHEGRVKLEDLRAGASVDVVSDAAEVVRDLEAGDDADAAKVVVEDAATEIEDVDPALAPLVEAVEPAVEADAEAEAKTVVDDAEAEGESLLEKLKDEAEAVVDEVEQKVGRSKKS